MNIQTFTLNNRRVRIETDHDASNPRIDMDNVPVMVCKHRNYDLGDKHALNEFAEAVQALAVEQGIETDVSDLTCPDCGGNFRAVDKNEKAWKELPEFEDVEIEYFNGLGIHTLTLPACMLNWDADAEIQWRVADCKRCNSTFEIENPYYFEDNDLGLIMEVLQKLDPDEKHIFFKPLSLYDHSGLSISTSAPQCPWDSGWVGVCYVTRKKVIEELACKKEDPIEDIRAAAYRAIDCDVDIYDQYLRGQVYTVVLETLRPCPDDWDHDEWASINDHWLHEDACGDYFSSDMYHPTLENMRKCGMTDIMDDEWERVVNEGERS